MNSLDFSIAPDLCSNLQQLYIYINERLTHANIQLDPEAMEEVIQLLNTLRDGWKQALATEQDPTQRAEDEG
jgi:flagellar protein FliS